MDTNQGNRPGSGQMRIVQELVAGKEITLAHIIGGPLPIVYQKLGLNPDIDYRTSAIGIMNLTPPESAVIASDIAVKSGNVYLGFADRFSGTLIITGEIAEVTTAIEEIVNYFQNTLGYVVCPITKR
ncbi:MAG: BMC domain-containing protein [Clostridiales bacterium]|jgi:ethanolamine utilization protein EutS|nr:BMC domain-containing protein [Clostridiales bacterium]MBQ3322267.1 BMC domain-containing protein [Bacillota bacterium]MBR0456662.1 BMC domain-containing protein [Bacillota bacterium]